MKAKNRQLKFEKKKLQIHEKRDRESQTKRHHLQKPLNNEFKPLTKKTAVKVFAFHFLLSQANQIKVCLWLLNTNEHTQYKYFNMCV